MNKLIPRKNTYCFFCPIIPFFWPFIGNCSFLNLKNLK